MLTQKLKLVALTVVFALALAACDKPNLAEKAGRDIDRVAEKGGDKPGETSKKPTEQTAKTSEVLEDAAITTKTKTVPMAESGPNVLDIECGYGGRRGSPRWLCRFASQ